MTDSIIARLRNPYWVYGKNFSLHDERWRKDRIEAADEIERLEAKLAEMTSRLKYSEQVIISMESRGYSKS